MKKVTMIGLALLVVGLIGITALPASAVDGNITGTVTLSAVSVQVTPSTIDWGTKGLAPQAAMSPEYTATNNGDVVEDFAVSASNASNGTNTWILANIPGPNQYALDLYDRDGTGSMYLSTTPATWPGTAAGVAIGATKRADSALYMPTSSVGGVYTLTITVTATAH